MYRKFVDDIKNNTVKKTFFLYGEENFQVRWAVGELIKKYISPEFTDMDVLELSGDNYVADDIISIAMTYSMMSEYRVLIVRDYKPLYSKVSSGTGDKASMEYLIELAKNDQSPSMVIYTIDSRFYDKNSKSNLSAFGKKLAAECSTYEFTKLDRPHFRSFIRSRVKREGKYISDKNIDFFIDVSGYFNKDSDYDLDRTESDIKKIVLASEEIEIEASLIQDIVMGEEDRYVFNFIDALSKNKKDRAMQLVVNMLLYDEDSIFEIVGLLRSQFELMYDCAELSSSGMSISEMAKKLRMNRFRVERAYEASKRVSNEKLVKSLINLYNMDRDLKTGNMSIDASLELFVSSF